nr:MAG TPA: hypothetical protein [Caudoviricetes sp.]
MSHQIYKNRQYKIYKAVGGYVVHNSNKPFEKGHTHIERFDTAKYLIHLSVKKIVPKHLSKYLIVSLIRIAEDKKYKNELYKLLGGN